MDIVKTIQKLRENNIEVYEVDNKDLVVPQIRQILGEGKRTVAVGGSVTLEQCGVIDYLNEEHDFLDRNAQGLTKEQSTEMLYTAVNCDVYLSSTNAITEDGELYNVDGRGNRVAAMSVARRLIIVAGTNKIVKDLDAAVKRVKTVAAPKNAVRRNYDTPCKFSGHCVAVDGGFTQGCKSPMRLCSAYSILAYQRQKDRVAVILVKESLGY